MCKLIIKGLIKMFKNKKYLWFLVIIGFVSLLLLRGNGLLLGQLFNKNDQNLISLKEIKGDNKIIELLYERKSRREYNKKQVSFDVFSRVVWSTVGINTDGLSGPTRTAPSAGATNPLVIYISVSNVENLDNGLYKYLPEQHALKYIIKENISNGLAKVALDQNAVREAPATLLITADYNNTTNRYGKRGIKYVHIESGTAAQNALLTIQKHDMGGVIIGAFENEKLQKIMGEIPEEPLVVLPFGYYN